MQLTKISTGVGQRVAHLIKREGEDAPLRISSNGPPLAVSAMSHLMMFSLYDVRTVPYSKRGDQRTP
jgi:hypothetical protein